MLPQKMFALLPSLFAAAQVFAVSVYEPFSYPVGDLGRQGGWVLTAGTLDEWARKLWDFDLPYRHPGRSLGTATQIDQPKEPQKP